MPRNDDPPTYPDPLHDDDRRFDNGCQHRTEVVLAGRRVCNDGCGTDLGPA